MLAYILKLILIQAIGLGIYYAFLRNEKLFGYARIFLWSVISASFIVPLIFIPLFQAAEPLIVLNAIPYQIQPQEISITVAPTSTIDMMEVFLIVYLLLTLTTLGRLFMAYWKLVNIKKRSKFESPNLYFSKEIEMPYSFLNGIFIPNTFLDDSKLSLIIAHENEHIQRKHTWDKIAISLLANIMWFNPLLRLFHKELEAIHEYQVDESVTATHSLDEYLQSLLQSTIYLKSNPISLTHSFFSSPIKNRIIMLYKKSKNKNAKRILSFVVLLIAICTTLFVQSQNLQKKPVVNTATELEDKDTTIIENPVDGTYIMTVTNDDGTIQEYNMTGDEIASVLLKAGLKDSVIKFDSSEGEFVLTVNTPDTTFTAVEQQAEYPGGESAMLDFLAKNIKYPNDKESKKMNGVIYLEFIIGKDGEVTNIKSVRTPNGMESHEVKAIEAVKKMPNWIPAKNKGKVVRQYFTLPISYEAQEENEERTNLEPSSKDTALVELPSGEMTMVVFDKNKPVNKNAEYDYEKRAAKFPGGRDAMFQFIQKNIKYPKFEKENRIAGIVTYNFVIDKNGQVRDVQHNNKDPKLLNLAEEGVRIFKRMPKWKAATKANGELDIHEFYNVMIDFNPSQK